MLNRRRRLWSGIATAALAAALLAGCGSGDSESSSSDDGSAGSDVESALKKGGEITVWAWEPTLEKVVQDFEAAHPNVKIDLVNAGTGNDQYTALQNAIKAGSGVPDIAQVEYYALPQFALADSLADLSSYGADDLEGTFTPGPWNAVHNGDQIDGLPMDSGPMALFYNKKVFDTYGIDVPTTWDEYVTAAEKLHKADPKAYIANDTGDAGFATSMIWQAGGRPFTVDGTDVKVDFSDEGTQKFATTWQKLIDESLLAPVSSWSDEWYQGLGDGTIATLTIGAWMPANLESGVPDAAGDWRVTQMPQWEDGGTDTSENGGSSLAVTEASSDKALAYAFMKYATVDEGAQSRADNGAFPATTVQLEDGDFLDAKSDYFGGQQVNKVLAQSAEDVVDGWSYLPYQVYANSIFNDTVGQAYVSDTSFADGLSDWQSKLVDYGNEQGFNVGD